MVIASYDYSLLKMHASILDTRWRSLNWTMVSLGGSSGGASNGPGLEKERNGANPSGRSEDDDGQETEGHGHFGSTLY